jgi:hypothetical protein
MPKPGPDDDTVEEIDPDQDDDDMEEGDDPALED